MGKKERKLFFKRVLKMFETYLFEYCEINNVKEVELGDLLSIAYIPKDGSIFVFNSDDERDIKIGVRLGTREKCSIMEIFGEFDSVKYHYPKTFRELIILLAH